MRIGIDLQAMQTANSGKRGIGRYTGELTKAILGKSTGHEVLLGLNNSYQAGIPDIIRQFPAAGGGHSFFYYDLIPASPADRDGLYEVNSLLLKHQFRKQGLDLLHFASIFEGFGEEAVVPANFRGLEPAVRTVTLYDLIPLIYKDIYCRNEAFAKWYHRKLHVLYQADLILAISDATRSDAINLLGIPADRIINISGAANTATFRKTAIPPDRERDFRKKHALTGGFILYTGGIDYRKNIETALRAYSLLDRETRMHYQFVLVCKISPAEKDHLEAFIRRCNIPPGRVIFTGYVPDDELNIFYNLCTLFVFPSLYEGFGLPVLEAMNCGAPVIGSRSSSIPEIVGDAAYLFDPTDPHDVAEKMRAVLMKPALQGEMREHSRRRSRLFSWEKSASTAMDGFAAASRAGRTAPVRASGWRRPLRIAYFSPLPDQKSGIADFSEDFLPFLSRHVDIDLYTDDYTVRSDMLTNSYPIYSYRLFETRRDRYDAILYHFGNSRYHSYMYDILLKHPGIVILHDFFLGHFMYDHSTILKDNRAFFYESMTYSHGALGTDYIRRHLASEIGIESLVFDLPMSKKLLDAARTVIVHSRYAQSLARDFFPSVPQFRVVVMNQPIKAPSLPTPEQKRRAKADLKHDPDGVLICAFGHIVETKQYDHIIRAASKLDLPRGARVRIVFVGELSGNAYGQYIRRLIADSPAGQLFQVAGYVDAATYKRYLEAADIGINLRIKSRGETSRALLMNMAHGIPTIVNNEASFTEFPDNCVVKTSVDDPDHFRNCLEALISNMAYRKAIAENAYAHVAHLHAPDRIAEAYAGVIRTAMAACAESAAGQEASDLLQDLIEGIADRIVRGGVSPRHFQSIAELTRRCVANG